LTSIRAGDSKVADTTYDNQSKKFQKSKNNRKKSMLLSVLFDFAVQLQIASLASYAVQKSGLCNLPPLKLRHRHEAVAILSLFGIAFLLLLLTEHTWTFVSLAMALDCVMAQQARQIDSSVVAPLYVFWEKFFGLPELDDTLWADILLRDHSLPVRVGGRAVCSSLLL
jgi:hypothetical protein